jgi:hypothetical protein
MKQNVPIVDYVILKQDFALVTLDLQGMHAKEVSDNINAFLNRINLLITTLAVSCNCNGHGRCESMQRYAMTKDPGRGPVFKYNANWDAEKIFGCVCDPGYSGPSCTERTCPTGDDPLTGTIQDPAGIQRNEKQRVRCRATGGSFTLTFRGYTTEPILVDDSTAIVKRKLEAIPSIRAVTVTFGGITRVACTAIGNDISIEFTQDFGK